MKNIILGAGIARVSASYELQKNKIESVVYERNNSYGGLLDNFTINGFYIYFGVYLLHTH